MYPLLFEVFRIHIKTVSKLPLLRKHKWGLFYYLNSHVKPLLFDDGGWHKSAFQMQPLWKLVYDTQNDTKAQEMCQDLPHKFVTDTVKKRHGRAKITG